MLNLLIRAQTEYYFLLVLCLSGLYFQANGACKFLFEFGREMKGKHQKLSGRNLKAHQVLFVGRERSLIEEHELELKSFH